jgi:hypothetical protein
MLAVVPLVDLVWREDYSSQCTVLASANAASTNNCNCFVNDAAGGSRI